MFDIRKLQDININDVQLKTQYYNYFINGNIDLAHKIIDDNPDLYFKVLNADNLNKLVNHITELENNYYDNVDNILKDHLNNYQININDLIYMEEYSNQKQYEINNFVLYNDEIYYCFKKPDIGILPTNNSYWIYLGLKGDIGKPSLGVNYKGNWSSAINYLKYDMVVYQNKLYVAKLDNLNSNPSIESNIWSIQMQIEEQGIFVSEEEPHSLKEGNIWFQIL